MTDLQQLLEARRDAVRPLQEQLAAMQQQLRDLFEAGNPNPTTVGNLTIDMHDLRLQVRGARQDFKAGFESLLADDQKGKLEGLRRAARVVPVIKAAGQVGIL